MAEWRPVCGWPYEVSSEGQVRRIGCPVPLRAGLDKKTRYFKVVLHNAREGRNRTTFAVHSLVAEAFIGPCPKGLEVNHKDRDRGNNRADNLEYLTHLENVRHGPTPSGEHNYAAKLTSEQVMEVRSLYSQLHKPAALARRFNVDRQTIVDAIRGKNWKHLPGARALHGTVPQTHCKRGHPLSGTNMFRNTQGWRVCRICRNDKQREQRKLRKQEQEK